MIQKPYLLYLGDANDELSIKLARGVLTWDKDACIAEWSRPNASATLNLPHMTPEDAVAAGAKTLVVGLVNSGGTVPVTWVSDLENAVVAGLDIAAGMHVELATLGDLRALADKHGRTLHELRRPQRSYSTASGVKRTGKRVLTVGTDCSVGKMFTSVALTREMERRNLLAKFCATGQTGTLVSGEGIAVDAIVGDFMSGAVESLCPSTGRDAWQIVEGQGSLFHPAFAGVTLGLLHGSQPDCFIVCHEPTRTKMRGVDHPMPTLKQVVDATLLHGALTNPDIKLAGFSINTSKIDATAAKSYLSDIETEFGVPATDPIRFGVTGLVDALQKQAR